MPGVGHFLDEEQELDLQALAVKWMERAALRRRR